MEKVQQIIKQFLIDGEVLSVKLFGSGHVNRTFLVETTKRKYVLQKINTFAFTRPKELMDNIIKVTKCLESQNVETMTFVPTKDGEYYYQEQSVYRMYIFVDDVVVFEKIPNSMVFKQAGFAFGDFINHLKEFNANDLAETIKDFHNTPKRFADFKQAVKENASGRANTCLEEINFVLEREDTLKIAVTELANGNLPVRVTHNDTKLNNILIDEKTLIPRMVIDLDTVMAGSLIYDFGDAIRFGASTADEDEKDLTKVHFNMDLFCAFSEGFCSALKDTLTDREWELLSYGAYLMTIECGMRFLADYIQGDVYFSTAYPEHNLVRARTQLKLAKEMQETFTQTNEFIKSLKKRLKA
jgi:N-acetylhexosamine 1-kinase